MGRRPSGRWNRNLPGTVRSLRRNLTVAAKVPVNPLSILILSLVSIFCAILLVMVVRKRVSVVSPTDPADTEDHVPTPPTDHVLLTPPN